MTRGVDSPLSYSLGNTALPSISIHRRCTVWRPRHLPQTRTPKANHKAHCMESAITSVCAAPCVKCSALAPGVTAPVGSRGEEERVSEVRAVCLVHMRRDACTTGSEIRVVVLPHPAEFRGRHGDMRATSTHKTAIRTHRARPQALRRLHPPGFSACAQAAPSPFLAARRRPRLPSRTTSPR